MPESCGIVELDKRGIVQAFHEKIENPPSNLANAGVYILEPTIFDFLKSLNKINIDFSLDVIPAFIGKINTFHNSVYHRDIGTIESLKLVQKQTVNSDVEMLLDGYKIDPLLSLDEQITLLAEELSN
jgi:mannose-1-phosphate guanylyltransferase